SRAHGARAGLAADRDEAAVVELVVRKLVVPDVLPHLGERRAGEGIPLHEWSVRPRVPRIQLDHAGVVSGRALVTTLPAHPALVASERATERLHFANRTALFMAVHVKAEEPLLANERLDARRIGKHHLDLDPEVLPHPIDETVRLRVEAARIEREHAERTPALHGEVEQHHVFGAAPRDHEVASESLER